jgi:hypothetical protein
MKLRDLSSVRKAVAALVGTEAAAIGSAMLDGNLTTAEAIAGTGMALVVAFAAWRVPNTPA